MGMLDAACPGEVFTSPTPDQMDAATKAVDGGAGVLHIVKNYTGDVLNFEMAAELAAARGHRGRGGRDERRRGRAGQPLHRRPARRRHDRARREDRAARPPRRASRLAEVAEHLPAGQRRRAAAWAWRSRSCTSRPPASRPSSSATTRWRSASASTASRAASACRSSRRARSSSGSPSADRRGPAVRLGRRGAGLRQRHGRHAADRAVHRLRRAATSCSQGAASRSTRNLVGNYITSLEMAGCSITLLELDDEMTRLWDAPVAHRRRCAGARERRDDHGRREVDGRGSSGFAAAVGGATDELTAARLGDRRRRPRHQHGPRHAGGGARSSTAASRRRHRRAPEGRRHDARSRRSAAPAGPLYGTLFLQIGQRRRPASAELDARRAGPTRLDAGVAGRAVARGKAEPGDKTMIDALLPAREALRARGRRGRRLRRGARACGRRPPSEGMEATIPLVARKGRASYLGERSAGHQDPGATSSRLLLGAARRGTGPAALEYRGRRKTWRKYAGSDRPGHHQHPLHDLRPRRQGRRDRPEGARADLPKPGWVEHDPAEIWARTAGGDRRGAERRPGSTSRRHLGHRHHQPARDGRRVGPEHRRAGATTRSSGRTRAPTRSATSCRRDGGQDRFRREDGPADRHLLLRPEGALDPRQRRRRPASAPRPGDLLFGNMDTWVIWNLTGGTDGGLHITDVSNASRTMLMDLETLDWDDRSCSDAIGVPTVDAPRDQGLERGVRRGHARRPSTASRSPATSATSRRRSSARPASRSGEAKNTYGTGNFLLLNTGTEAVHVEERPASPPSATRSATRPTVFASRARSRSPARSCSGCATT